MIAEGRRRAPCSGFQTTLLSVWISVSVGAWVLCIGVAQDAPKLSCVDTCNAGTQRARNNVCEERSLTGAPCEASHSCLCELGSDGSDCQYLRPCTPPNEMVEVAQPAPAPPASSRTSDSAAMTRGDSVASRPAPSAGKSDKPLNRQAIELALAVSVVLLLVTTCWYSCTNGNRRLAGKGVHKESKSSAVPSICRLAMQVARAKGLSTGRMFKASVRVTVVSDRIAHVVRKHTAVRDSVYSPNGFSVNWYEDFDIPIVSEDCTVSVEVVEHVLAHPDGAPTPEEQVLATMTPWSAMYDHTQSDNGWHELKPARVEYSEQVEGASLKLRLVRHTSQISAGASLDQPFDTSTAEELGDAMMQGSEREDAIRACLEHTQKIMMGAVSAAPMSERKPVYQQATKQLAALASQPLCASSAWNTDAGRGATHAVGDLMYQIFNSPVDTNRQLDIRRATRFVRTVEVGPEYAKMYGILAAREDSACAISESEDGSAAMSEPEPRQPDLRQGAMQPTQFQTDDLGGQSATGATTTNPLSVGAVDDDV